ncbi:thaumatin [Circinella umbellata]|nr:thaumatin [Circinella umbellata]
MYTSLKFVALAALAGFASASQIIVKNHCAADAHVGQLKNGESQANFQVVAKGAEKVYELPADWQGRFWGRTDCEGDACNDVASAASPASLAEITFKGYADIDYYDVSFVDGFNLPIKMGPIGGDGTGDDEYKCGAPTCAKVPDCPNDAMKVEGPDGKLIGCKSACSAFNTEETCCSGAHNTPETCGPNEYSKAVKAACPDAYSYAYDDQSSTYTCQSDKYEIIFCP